MEKKSILMLGPSLGGRGGIARVVQSIIENWKSDQFVIKPIVTHKDGGAVIKILSFLSGLLQYFYYLIIFKPVIIYAHFSVCASFYRKSIFLLVAKLCRKKIVIHSHTGEFQIFYDESALLLRQFIKYVLGLADMIVVLGKSERVIFNRISEHDRCTVIHNSIKCPKVTALLNMNPPVICTMGELGLRKGTYDLLKAIPLVLQEYPEVEFLLCGNGELAKIQDIIKKKQIERSVRICGYVEGRKKEEVYLNSTVYVLPSYYEGMPQSLLEAMSYGLPVVTTNVNAIPDLVQDGVNGLLIEPGDIHALAQKIIMLLGEEHLRTELGNNARSHVSKNFNVDAKLLDLETEFKGLL